MVYCGGLENRFGLTADGGSNPSLSASPAGRDCRAESRRAGGRRVWRRGQTFERRLGKQEKLFVNDLVVILIWVVLIGGVFAYLWRKGYLLKISDYVQQTREELRKCTWPGWDELKGSTVVITISIGILGLFTYVVDRIFYVLVLWISKV